MKSIVSVLLVLALGAFAAFAQTDGFTVLTTEAARRADIARQPMPIPAARMRYADGQAAELRSALAADGRVAIVNFMYTRCASVCVAMGNEFQQLQDAIKRRGLEGDVRLISISFDPGDTPQWLTRYQDRMKIDSTVWQAMLAFDDRERKALLDAFGIIVVPAPMGQYEHNTAYHVVTPDGRLARIVDISNTDVVLHYALEQSRGPTQQAKR